MEHITRKTISKFLESFPGIGTTQQLFSEEVQPDRRERILNKTFEYFTGHSIDPEGNLLSASSNASEQVKAFYYEIKNFNHLQNFEQLLTELKAARQVSQSMEQFNTQVTQHRAKTQQRLSELKRGDILQSYTLEPKHS